MTGPGDPFTYYKIEVPTVVGQLRNILSQYPDNGQIVKELVQNAEDAGATTVEVVHVPDHFSVPEAQEVVHRFLQGPAVSLYNDAVFSEEDWHGIRKLSESIKKDNPLQVGQFGLGFKSVFHLTDYVTIISGREVLFMDPSEPEERMCRCLPLQQLSEVVPTASTQRAFGHRLTPQQQAAGNFPGTLFWFPLRQTPSKISDTVYTAEHVKRLFGSFGVEASVCLTFLKSLEKITIGRVESQKMTVTRCMEITSSNMTQMRNKRQAFRQELQQCKGSPSKALSCSYDATLHTGDASGNTCPQNMRILHLLPGKKDAEWMKWGGKDTSKHIPLVGVAVPTSMPAEAAGHIFSFLPLPPDPTNQTGLPIQVNGAFILNQNRRQVKWRTSESSKEADVVWNEELVVKVVAKAYTGLLKELLKEAWSGSIDATTWYSFLPDLGAVTGRWLKMGTKVWRDLLALDIISSEVSGFLKVQDVLTCNDLNDLKPAQMASTVKKVLCSQSLPLATLPSHVLKSLRILDQDLNPVTPRHLRRMLSKCSTLKKEWNREHLLCYAAKDANYKDLCGLSLLPLQDKTWGCFRFGAEPVYLCSRQEAEAVRGLEGQVVDVNVAPPVFKILQAMAESGLTQVCRFQAKQHGPKLLEKSVTSLQNSQLSGKDVERWLSAVWSIVQHLDLQSVEHIPLLPTSQPPRVQDLTSLASPLVQQGRGKLSRPQVEVLGLLGVVVVPALPSYVRHIELSGRLHSSDSYGTTLALNKAASKKNQTHMASHFNSQKTEEQRQALHSLIDTQRMQPQLKSLLRVLRVFKAQDRYDHVTDVCLAAVNVMAPEIQDFPVSYPETLLTPSLPQEWTLALALGAVALCQSELCVRALRSCCGDEDTSRLVSYILSNTQLAASSTVLQELKNTRFVPCIAGSLCRPAELYDPDDDDRDALIGETQTPSNSFRQHLPLLRSLGLRKVQDTHWKDLVSLVKHLQNTLLSETQKAKKSAGLLRAVNRHSDCQLICREVMRVSFVFGASRPPEYPTSLQWGTPPGLLSLQDLTSYQHGEVCGSALAVVRCHDVPAVAEACGWTAPPPVDAVIRHLHNIKMAYQQDEWTKYFSLVKKTYCQLAALLDAGAAQLAVLKADACIFTEQGFKNPTEVYIRPGGEDLYLQPYLHPLPLELRESEALFLLLGCSRQQTPALLLAVLQAIRERHQAGDSSREEVERDRRLVVSVLERLQHHTDKLAGPLLVPVRTQHDALELAEAQHSAYTDATTEWIDSDELEVSVVHQCVSVTLARALGVAPLQDFLSAGGEAVMEWGQREPLTTRLHNLLRQYRDGVSVLKELVQNADDAGATTVRLLYDQRQNEGSRSLLLGSGMAQCQGPALWAYNDACFSEQDFKNLREIGAGTKDLQPTKIGKFGLGFCSVYNLTDVPSFVSGPSYVVFDPHMTHLDTATSSPGMRFNFTSRRNSYMLRTLQGQFQPFRGVFGCDIQEHGSFPATLFRLPLRTPAQASASKISDACYSHQDMVQLLGMFSAVVGQLLLFTQHVSSISVCHLPASAASPTEMAELFSASRGTPGSIPNLLPIPTIGTQSLLERTAALFSKQQQGLKWDGGILAEKSTAEVRVRNSQKGATLCGIEEGEWGTTWVTSWHSGSAKSCCLAETHQGRALPLAAMAVPVCHGDSGWQPQRLADLPPGFYHEGHFHCFLPLPVKTFLPVQVNGVLEVASDRTSLLTQTEDDRHTLSWNTTLLGDAAVRAHLGLAEALRHLGLCAGSEYYATWPVVGCGGGSLVEGLTTSFYHTLQQEDLELFRCGRGEWHPFSRCCILEEDFLRVPEVGEAAFEFLEAYLQISSEMRMVRLPGHVQAGFDKQVLAQHTITQEIFFQQYFVPHLSAELVSTKVRDLLTIHLLESGHHYVELLRSVPCIPTQPHGVPRPPCDLISPKTRIAEMFSVEDERFPLQNFLNPITRSDALSKLGMSTDSLPQELVVERAQSVTALAQACPECARHRISELLHYLQMQDLQKQGKLAHELKLVPFLPVMPKPEKWSVAWHKECPARGEPQCCSSHRGVTCESLSLPLVLERPPALCLPAFKPLVGSFHALLEQSSKRPPQKVLERLGVTVNAHSLPLVSVVKQLCEFSTAVAGRDNARMCHAIYEHLEDFITLVRREKTLNNINEIKKLRDEKILITSHGFAAPRLFGVHSETDCAPDLFSARAEGLDKYECLMDLLGIRENFEFEAVMEVIQKKRETFADRRLGVEDVLQVSRLLNVLFQVREGSAALERVLHLPDSQGLLRSTQDLCLDDGAELSSGQFLCLHPSISVSRDMSEWLSIKSKTRKRLSESSSRLRFGQKEPLTTRLRNILSEYPCDSGIMKELLQNADDAGATEVTFYKDFRHLPDQKLFDPMWAPLQGPALIVFNNKGFTEQDLQSIQDLGNSSKREDPATTGQYGIGFNAVYHLTDAPSFLSKGPQVPQGETLCMFDPHCWYDPSATPESPGVQFINLSDLRQDHPDSFTGYLEQHFTQEGTMFRLPLRTSQDSLISKKILKEDDVCKMLKEFERDMSQCLLFLRNVKKVSIKKVQRDGQCEEEYCVQATAPKSKSSDLPVLTVKHRDAWEARDPCALDVTRTSCTMTIQDSRGSSSQWLVVQQLGVKEKNSLPEIVREAFRLKTLNMLPHGGVAILLDRNTPTSNVTDMFSTSCYLPLPAQSGLPFSINGHFTLNTSRRDLWTGRGDAKGLWNEWLLKELLVPVTICAIEEFRTLLFPGNDNSPMMEHSYASKVWHFHHVLPRAWDVHGERWKKFVKWFYEQVRDEELHFFDSFIPETDLPPPPPSGSGCSLPSRRGEPAWESRKGRLVWHAFHASGDQFPVYFTSIAKEAAQSQQSIADILRRLGMKVSSEGMHLRLVTADNEFQCPLLTPDVALAFVKSWEQDVRDRCRPQVGNQVAGTPFLKPGNVLSILQYIMGGEGFSDTSVDRLPLLVTNDGVLGCFSIQEPVFLSSFCDLLPEFGKEFTLYSHVSEIEASRDKFKGVVKTFTPADLAKRLPHVLDAAQCAANARLPLPDRQWLLDLWRFVVQYVEKAYLQEGQMDWAQAKQYILRTLGKWAFYPVTERGQAFVIPIEQAWQVLDVSGHITDSAFHSLPVPVPLSVGTKDHGGGSVFSMVRNYVLPAQKRGPKNPYIPTQLQLAATLTDPAAVLQLLDFHRESVNLFFEECSKRGKGKVVIDEILEYLGKHCSKFSQLCDKIQALQVFPGPSGLPCTLQGRKLVVLAESVLKLDELKSVCSELSLLVVPKPYSDNVTNLYTYIEPNCLLEELDLYTRFILPNMRLLNETQRMYYLEHLNKNLPHGSERKWNAGQQRVIATLRTCPFIDLNGTLKTADQFYDPLNKVFCVMGLANLPEAWRERKWHHLLMLAGMVHSVSPDMFVGYASSLSVGDESVKKKSKVLCEYLEDHYEDLQPKISDILRIQFLVPEKYAKLEALLPLYQTHSGLLAFSESVNQRFANIIWSTRSLLPSYATGVARKLQRHYANQVNVESPPAVDVLEHIVKFCSSMQATPEKSPEVVGCVMESIYEHLSQHGGNEMQSLKERDIPIIHIPDHSTFVSTSHVVGSLEEEILPYLYKAPVIYGKFFRVFQGLGMLDSATPNTYARVLEMIHEASGQKSLHPAEASQMKMALRGLVKDRYKLKDLSVPELYLPAQDETLRRSSQMFVADNDKLLVAVQKEFQEPIFFGFKPLEINLDDSSFVKLLPQRLQPKFLSEACKITLQQEGMLEEATMILGEIHELLQSQEFKTGVLRILHHYKLQHGSGLTKEEKEDVLSLLTRVTVRQVSIIRTTITLRNTVVGQQERKYFMDVQGEGDQRTWILYLSKKFPPKMIPNSLCEVYVRVLSKWDTRCMMEFLDVFACHGKPHDIHKSLDERGVKEYSADMPVRSLFRSDVGTYLEERFLPLLDNSFSEFHEKEIVCMRKYLCGNEGADPDNEDAEENDIFVIVEVVKLVEKHPTCHMQNTYQVNTSRGPPCIVTVRAHQLYRFIRKDDGTSQPEFESREDIFRKIREQLRRIWQVEDERERRHLLRRLQFRWHPDKNPEQVELCTQVMQYMMSLVGRLERGEAIPEEEDPTNPSQAAPSETYSRCFRPPPQRYRNRNRNWNRREPDPPRQPRPDLPEARRWLRQARGDLEAAEAVVEQVPWWAVFMCYQAAEKVLLAALFVQDREVASRKQRDGPLERTLTALALQLGNPRAVQLAHSIQQRTGHFLEPLYPTFGGCPRDRYTLGDANHVLPPCRELLQVLGANIV